MGWCPQPGAVSSQLVDLFDVLKFVSTGVVFQPGAVSTASFVDPFQTRKVTVQKQRTGIGFQRVTFVCLQERVSSEPFQSHMSENWPT